MSSAKNSGNPVLGAVILAVVAFAWWQWPQTNRSESKPPKTFAEFVANEGLGEVTPVVSNDGSHSLVISFDADGSAEALDHSQRVLRDAKRAGVTIGNSHTVRFIARAILIDRLGHKSIEPALSYDLDGDDVRIANFENLGTPGLMRLVKNVSVIHPAIAKNIAKMCGEASSAYKSDFCVLAANSIGKQGWYGALE